MPALSWPVAAAVLGAALLHGQGALIALPFALWVGLPAPAAWPFIAASLVIHVGYDVALAGAYQHGALGMTSPIMRRSAPLLVAPGRAAVVGEAASALAWLGAIGITLGVALVGLAHPRRALYHGHRALRCRARHIVREGCASRPDRGGPGASLGHAGFNHPRSGS